VLTDNQLSALKQIKQMLESEGIQFLVIGGLAAIAWGVNRPLADIDLQVSKQDLKTVRDIFAEYLKHDIRHYQTERWDIIQMVLQIEGITVDICQAEDFYVLNDGLKHLVRCVSQPAVLEIQGVSLPVIPKTELIKYKRLLGRAVDKQDLIFIDGR
jgi:predicted nucleotidyltransferase